MQILKRNVVMEVER